MKKTKNKLIYWLIPVPILAIGFLVLLSSNGGEINLPLKNQLNPSSRNEQLNSNEAESERDEETDAADDEQLALSVIPDKCRGCGKCMRTDPEHFEVEGDVAAVISQENLDSAALASAIDGCPFDAIELNKN